jgi:hypothetical protein
VLAFTAATVVAAPISYNIALTTVGVSDAASTLVPGSFIYDPDADLFSSFFVGYDGVSYDLTSAANTFNSGLAGCSAGPSCAFSMMTDGTPESHVNTWSALVTGGYYRFSFFQNFPTLDASMSLMTEGSFPVYQPGRSPDHASGTWSVTAAPTFEADLAAAATPAPEPSTISFLLLGALGIARSKIAEGIRRTRARRSS